MLFRAKTKEGHVLKVLMELLHNNITDGCFIIDGEGMRLRMMDGDENKQSLFLIDLVLEGKKFTSYKFKNHTPLQVGIRIGHCHKMLKSLKKKDSIELFIDEKNPTELGIKVVPKENTRTTTSFIQLQTSQNLDIDLPTGYGRPIIINSSEFQKMCKGLPHISSETSVFAHKGEITFTSNADDVMKRSTQFGDNEDSDNEDTTDEETEDYNESFDTDQFGKIAKLAGLYTNLYVYVMNGNPLLFQTDVGSLGKISVYLKSKNDIENETHTVE